MMEKSAQRDLGAKWVDGVDVSYPEAYGGEVAGKAGIRAGKDTPRVLARNHPFWKSEVVSYRLASSRRTCSLDSGIGGVFFQSAAPRLIL